MDAVDDTDVDAVELADVFKEDVCVDETVDDCVDVGVVVTVVALEPDSVVVWVVVIVDDWDDVAVML